MLTTYGLCCMSFMLGLILADGRQDEINIWLAIVLVLGGYIFAPIMLLVWLSYFIFRLAKWVSRVRISIDKED